jgi:hypothetical protein
MLTTDRSTQLDELLGISIAEFDIPDHIYKRAVERYEHAASWLADCWPDGQGEIYTQGSIRLGTMIAPVNSQDEYDIDLVCRRDIVKETTTQRQLKRGVGGALADYVASRPEGHPQLREGKRCWTLDYTHEPFHMDVLPAIPDREGLPSGILLTDRELNEWQHSNPIAYAEWFQERMSGEFLHLREAIAKRMDIEDAPPSLMKTSLQRTVQALKRHRDLYFAAGQPKDAPASIIITTLAARAYTGGGSLHEVLIGVTARMPDLVERVNGLYVIPNPVADENFADRWKGHPTRAERFFDWIEQAHADFAGLGEKLGVHHVLKEMARSFGELPAKRAGERLGISVTQARDAGALGIASTGLLAPTTTRPIPRHTFHGDAPTR